LLSLALVTPEAADMTCGVAGSRFHRFDRPRGGSPRDLGRR
jgi:hypothetical protein